MANLNISIDLSGVLDASRIINQKVFPLLSQAVRAVAQQTLINWSESVQRARLWGGEKDTYIKSITWEMRGDFSAVVRAEYDKAEEIETGRPAKDLKRYLDTSSKVRRTKDGRRFLIIPFRHNSPGNDGLGASMPASVYDKAKNLTASKIVGMGQRPSGEITSIHPKFGTQPLKKQTPFASNIATKKTLMVPKKAYEWGGSLGAGNMPKMRQNHVTDIYAGMKRFDTSAGGKKSSTYMTFRIMGDWQAGKWIVPAQPGQFIAKKVTEEMRPLAELAFQEAVKMSL